LRLRWTLAAASALDGLLWLRTRLAPFEARLLAIAAPMPGGVSRKLYRRLGGLPREAPVMMASLPARGCGDGVVILARIVVIMDCRLEIGILLST
jgi:hypothetical protein